MHGRGGERGIGRQQPLEPLHGRRSVFSARPAQLHFHLRYFMQDKAGRICVVPALIPREKHLRDRFAADAAFPSRF